MIYKSVPGAIDRWSDGGDYLNPGFQGFVRKSDAMEVADYWRKDRGQMYVLLQVVFYDAIVGPIKGMTSIADDMKGIAGKRMKIKQNPGLVYVGINPKSDHEAVVE